MKERPILMSGPMVCAALDGTKTQTRRVCTLACDRGIWADAAYPARDGMPVFWWNIVGGPITGRDTFTQQVYATGARCPWGIPGDRLWVREAWRHYVREDRTVYRADGEEDVSPLLTWRPSIHMPRVFSRLSLELTNVRVERLQDITDDDALAEGFQRGMLQPREAFHAFWDLIYGKRYPWKANPWVWAVEFTRAP